MLRPALLALLVAACSTPDPRSLTLEGPDVVTVDRFGPVRGPEPRLSDGSIPESFTVAVEPADIADREGPGVSARKAGAARVDLLWNGQKASWVLKVEPRATIRILEPPAALGVGARQPLHVEVQIGGEATDPGEIAWSSSDEAIATVSAAGEVVGVAPGVVYVTARKGAAEAMAEIAIQ